MDRIGLLVDLIGNKEAIGSLKQLKSFVDQLNNKNISLRADSHHIQRDILSIEKRVNALRRQKNEIRFDTGDLKRVQRELKELEAEKRDLARKKETIKFDFEADRSKLKAEINDLNHIMTAKKFAGLPTWQDWLTRQARQNSLADLELNYRINTTDLNRQIHDVQTNIDRLTKERDQIKLDTGILDAVNKELAELEAEKRELTEKNKDINMDVKVNTEGIRLAKGELQELERTAYSIRDVIGGIGDAFSTIGGGLQSIGGIFNTDILGYMKQYASWFATDKIIGNWQDAANRFDIMNTFKPYMNVMGISNKKAEKSLARINEEIQGLPVGLDEAAFQTRRYTMFLGGDVKKATNLVAGLNKALIAGGAPASMRNYAVYEVERLLASGKLNTARQWMALINGLGISTKFLKDAMGLKKMPLKDFISEVTSTDGAISGKQFLSGIMNLADDKELQKAIDIYKSTLESGMSNLQFAITRGKEGIFQALNDMFIDTKGMNISDYLYEGRDFLNRAFGGVANWIRDNPELIERGLDRIEGIFKRAEKFNWGKLGSSIMGSVEKLFDIVTWVYDHVPEEAITGFITFATVWATPLGKGFSLLGSIFNTLSRFPPMPNFGGLLRGFKGFGRLMPVMKTSLKDIGKGFLGASAFVGVIAEIGLVIYEFAKVGEVISKSDFSGFNKNIGPLTHFVGQVGILAGAMVGLFTALTTSGIGGVAVAGGELLTAGFAGVMGLIGGVLNDFVTLANNIANMDLPTNHQLDRLNEVIGSLAGTFGTNLQNVSIPTWKIDGLSKGLDFVKDLSGTMDSFKKIESVSINKTVVGDRINDIIGIFKDFSKEMATPELTAFDSGDNLKIVSNMRDTIEKINESVGLLNEIDEQMNETKTGKKGKKEQVPIDFTAIKNRVVGMLNNMKAIVKIVDNNESLFKTWHDKKHDEMLPDIVDSWNRIMENTNKLGETLKGSKTSIPSFKKFNYTAVFYNIKVLLTQITSLMDEISPDDINIHEANEEADKWDAVARKIGNYKNILKSLNDLAVELQKDMDAFTFVNYKTSQGKSTFLGDAINNINTMIKKLNEIEFGTIMTQLFDGNNINAQGMMDKMQALNVAVQSFYTIAMNLKNMKDILSEILDGEILTDFSSFASGISTTITGLPEMDDALEKAELLKQSVDHVNEIISSVSAMGDPLEQLTSEKDSVVSKLKSFLDSLQKIISGGGKEGGEENTSNMSAFVAQISQLKDALSQLSVVDFTQLTTSLQTCKTEVDNIKKAFSDMKKAADDAGTAVSNLKGKLDEMANAASGQASLISPLISVIGNVGSVASIAAGHVSSLSSAISGLKSKTITLTVNRQVTGPLIPGLPGFTFHTGGKVAYLARGGNPFKPKGTDTVPAMLTPGEWVINKKAVNKFGDSFMRRVNAMDIPGAMNALMSRTSWNTNSNVSYTTNNYNNQTVNQTFLGNKDSKSSYRRANRYVSAL